MAEHRSPEAELFRPLYFTKRWQRARLSFLRQHPLCKLCDLDGQVTAANVVDHIKPHKGNQDLFWDPANWQALCPSCHSRWKNRMDRGHGPQALDAHGWPL
jgi:5-methylcytosine-specific restriction protein A